MSNIKIKKYASAEEAAAAAGESLNQLLADNKDKPVLLMLSAGSALSVLDYVSQIPLTENLTVSVLDERFSQVAGVNNFLQLQKKDFYADAVSAGCSFFGTVPRLNESMQSLARRWEDNLRKWENDNPQGTIIATLGMGPDGHTAGIFVFPEDEKKFKDLFQSSQ
jgi:6-phosphogluconolactonase/glucosamine-6-phosphate isomerase/deaminase